MNVSTFIDPALNPVPAASVLRELALRSLGYYAHSKPCSMRVSGLLTATWHLMCQPEQNPEPSVTAGGYLGAFSVYCDITGHQTP